MRGHIVHLGLEGVGQSDSPQKVFPSGQKKAERSLWSKTKLQASPSAQLAKGAHERHRAWRGPIPASQPEPPASGGVVTGNGRWPEEGPQGEEAPHMGRTQGPRARRDLAAAATATTTTKSHLRVLHGGLWGFSWGVSWGSLVVVARLQPRPSRASGQSHFFTYLHCQRVTFWEPGRAPPVPALGSQAIGVGRTPKSCFSRSPGLTLGPRQ